MARQVIDIGVNPNDGEGDPIRTAGQKINENFEELYQDVSNVQGLTLTDITDNGDTTTNDITANTITADTFSAGGTGTPSITSLTHILLDAADYVEATAPFKVLNITTSDRNANLTPTNGMIIYNSTDNKFQGWANGAWVDLH